MKVPFIISLALLVGYHASAQKSFADFKPKETEQVFAFDPMGNIATSNNFAIVPDRSLSDSCLASLKSALKENNEFDISYIATKKTIDKNHQEYFMKLMERVERAEEAHSGALTGVKYGKYIKDLISDYNGKYFCFVFFSGLESAQGNSQNLETTAETTSNLYFPLATERSFLNSYILIVDKEKGTLAYFNHHKTNGSPVKKSIVENQVHELLSYAQE